MGERKTNVRDKVASPGQRLLELLQLHFGAPSFPLKRILTQADRQTHEAAEMLASFGMHKGGKEYRRLFAAFERIFGTAIYFGTDSLMGTAKLVHRSRVNLMSEAQIWYTRSAEQRVLSAKFENVIVLTEDLYCEVIEHPVQNDVDSVKVVASAPAVLDLYVWLSYRCSKAKGQESIPIFNPLGLWLSLEASSTQGGDGFAECSSSGRG